MAGVEPIRALASIPLSMIRVESNVRDRLTGIAELADSIRELGVLQPITVQRRPEGGFTVVFGHRRLAAAKVAGREAIPALIVGDYMPDDRLARQMAENTGRVQLDPIEEARGYARMIELGKSVAEVAALCGISQPTVRSRTALLSLSRADQARVRDGMMSLGDAGKVAALVRDRKPGAVVHRPPSIQAPRLMRGGLSGRVYVVTRYKVVREATATQPELIEAVAKYDVTEDFARLLAEATGGAT